MSSNPPILDLLRNVYLAGAVVNVVDDGLIGLTGKPCPESLKAELKASKPAVIDILKAQRIGELDDGYASPVPRRYVVPDSCLATKACARLGTCGHFLTRRGCGGES